MKPLVRYIVTAQIDAINEFAALEMLAAVATSSESLLRAASDGTIAVKKSRVPVVAEEPAA